MGRNGGGGEGRIGGEEKKREEKKERIVTKGPAGGSECLIFFGFAKISSKLTTFTRTADIISISVSWCLCFEVSISWHIMQHPL